MQCSTSSQPDKNLYVCLFVTENQYREAVNLLNIERERWERAMTQYAKVCDFLFSCDCPSVCLSLCYWT